jgi:polyhydroxyalkanoate synthesis regulator phasin
MASVRPYLQLASGILGMSAAKAAELAQGLWTQGGEVVGDTMGDVVDTAMEQGGQVAALLSPDQVRGLVREEVDRMVRRLGFAREDEVASLRREVGRLEQQLAAVEGRFEAGDAQHGDGKHGEKKPGDKKHKGKKGS